MSEPNGEAVRRIGLPPRVVTYLGRTQGADWIRIAAARPTLSATVLISVVTAAIYLATASREPENLDYFVRLADALLRGRLGLDEAPSWLNELIPSDGQFYVPYPPMPAVVLIPAVWVFGTAVPQQVASCIVGGVAVGLAWLMFGSFKLGRAQRLTLTAVFGLGTVLWFVAEVGSAWYFAHTVAVMFTMAAIALALRGGSTLLVGLLFGFATLSRLPVGLTAPFMLALVLTSGWPSLERTGLAAALRRGFAFGAGLAIPMAAYVAYNVARWGTPIDQGYVRIPGVLEDPIYEHGILSIAYIPRHVYAIFLQSWNYVDDPPFIQPSWWGLGLFLTTPLLVWLVRARLSDPRVAWAAVGIGLAAIPIVTHGNVGISQFGYRFSLDVQPLMFVILATVFERGMSRLAFVAAGASIAICAYAIWAISIGFVAY